GIALLGTVGLIDRSVISGNKANGQGAKGGGLAVEKNSESGNASLAVITGMEVKITNRPKGSYYVWGNTAPSPADADILGGKMQLSTPVTVQNDTSELNGSPAPSNPPEQTPHFLGTINLDEYCHAQYPRGTVSLKLTNAENIQCVLLSGTR